MVLGEDMFDKKLLKNFDITIVLLVILLFAIGLVAVASATHVHETHDYSAIQKQLLFFMVGLIAIGVMISIDYHTLGNLALYMYVVGIILLVAVLFTEPRNGAQSWFTVRGFTLQPSEFVKIITIISLSKHIDKVQEKGEDGINDLKNLIILLLHMAVPIALIMKQPDYGTASIFIAFTAAILFVAKIDYKYIVGAFVSAAVLLPLLYFSPITDDYQRDRIKVFLNPDLDPMGKAYNVIQSKIAIGSGQLFGKGLFKGTQAQLGYIPEQQTDFIFSVIGEELGFIWCSIVIIMFVLLFLRYLHLARLAKDRFGSYIITGVTAMMFCHMLINIGMTIGLVPVMGIPLPFISYGGSSLLTNMIAVGLVLNVAMRRQKIKF